MPRLFHRPPKYGLHKATKQAIVCHQGKMVYLGPYGSEKSHQRYREFLTEWNAARHQEVAPERPATAEDRLAAVITPGSLRQKWRQGLKVSIDELVFVYRQHANSYYVKHGKVTREAEQIEEITMRLGKERESALQQARKLLRDMHDISEDAIGRAEVDRSLADAKVRLLRKLGEKIDTAGGDSEEEAAGAEDSAEMLVSMALPAERQRIVELLALVPPGDESKTRELLRACADLWTVHPNEKIVVFTTYLGSVDALKIAIDREFPDAGVEVLKGGDHGAKVAAERRFKRPNGPRILICTAAGREGINLQFARVLFNHDLPWNPMDVEQRIGRIHRNGQRHTAQVYNLVSAQTIEGQIYLLLEEKLLAIGNALGKVDEYGQVAEDLRGQILGQLSERLSYEKLYQDAIQDPTLVRTRQELEVAMENASTARHVVFELFQDLEDFRLDDYHAFDDGGVGIRRLIEYVQVGVTNSGGQVVPEGPSQLRILLKDSDELLVTTDREDAMHSESLSLLGLDHPIVRQLMDQHRRADAVERGVSGAFANGNATNGVLAFWHVHIHGSGGQVSPAYHPARCRWEWRTIPRY